MRILALDLGTSSGWCRYDTESGLIESGRNNWEALVREDRVLAFAQWLAQELLLGADALFFEEVNFVSGHGGWVIHRQEGVLIASCLREDIAFHGVPVSTLKKFALHGRATKKEMKAAAIQWLAKHGSEVTKITEDEADAVLVAAYGLENHVIEEAA